MASTQESLTYKPTALAFGTSGLRALVTDMTDLECYVNALGFIRFLERSEKLSKTAKIHLAGDLRHSTPRIMRAMHKAIVDSGRQTQNAGLVPTPAVSFYAMQQGEPSIMVTGSHIPDDRNGIKFCKSEGEVLKEDELAIQEAVAEVRAELYAGEAGDFTPEGMFTQAPELPTEDPAASQLYASRFVDVFDSNTLAGKKIVFYEHSSVGRDMMAQLLEDLGAKVVRVGRSDKFVSIDTENVTPDDQAYFKVVAAQHPDAFAIISADGDADRPFVVDEQGTFHRGDVLGVVAADWLQADFAAFPVSTSDAVSKYLDTKGVKWQHTKIGSPYVIVVMQEGARAGAERVVGWEVNGGLLLGSDITMNGKTLKALPTRDAFLPILGALVTAIKTNKKISEIFAELPQRFTQAGLIDNFPPEVYRAITDTYLTDDPKIRDKLGSYFTKADGFGSITEVNGLDGVRMYFDNGDIAHIRLSSNAPQLRIYSTADTQQHADEIVALALKEPDGIFRRMQADITKK